MTLVNKYFARLHTYWAKKLNNSWKYNKMVARAMKEENNCY
jgi:hypothetical protein